MYIQYTISLSHYLTIMLNGIDKHAAINLASYRDTGLGSLYFRTTLLHNCLYNIDYILVDLLNPATRMWYDFTALQVN